LVSDSGIALAREVHGLGKRFEQSLHHVVRLAP
jgi:hypothetical protein